jgi:hypothetical protein
MWLSDEPMYLLQVSILGDLLIALNESAIALFGAKNIDSTTPRFTNSDFQGRDLTSDRSQDEFTFTGTLKALDGTARTVKETHRKIAEGLWLVTATG